MNYKHEQLLPEERRLLFALNKEDPEEGHKIGHVRGDFDRNGTGFFTTWFPCYENLKTERFKAELQQVVDELRSDSEFSAFEKPSRYENGVSEASAKSGDRRLER